jgi:hypothetical protein
VVTSIRPALAGGAAIIRAPGGVVFLSARSGARLPITALAGTGIPDGAGANFFNQEQSS